MTKPAEHRVADNPVGDLAAPATPTVIHLPLDQGPSGHADLVDWVAQRAHALVARNDVRAVRHLQRVDTDTAVGVGENHLVLFELSQPTQLASADWIDDAGFGADHAVVHGRLAMHHELAPGPDSPGAAILYVHVDVDEGHLGAFLEWYVGIHVPAVVAAPGVIGARRLMEVPVVDGRRRFCTIYEMDDPTVPDQPATLEAGRIGACPPHLQPHRVARNNVYREVLHVPAS